MGLCTFQLQQQQDTRFMLYNASGPKQTCAAYLKADDGEHEAPACIVPGLCGH